MLINCSVALTWICLNEWRRELLQAKSYPVYTFGYFFLGFCLCHRNNFIVSDSPLQPAKMAIIPVLACARQKLEKRQEQWYHIVSCWCIWSLCNPIQRAWNDFFENRIEHVFEPLEVTYWPIDKLYLRENINLIICYCTFTYQLISHWHLAEKEG